MYLTGSHPQLRRNKRRSNRRRIIFLLILIIGGLMLLTLREQGAVQPLFIPTPTATRNPRSYADEGEAQFAAGNLKAAIAAYQRATAVDQKNVDYWVAMARVQIYAGLYEEALASAETALLVAPNSAKAHAIYAWALDWNSVENGSGCACRTLAEAQAEAVKAIALDSNYAPAHAYYSEILADAGQWDQGFLEAQTALQLDPNLLEARRAMGYSNEVVGNYQGAVQHYQSALEINPNLMLLYIKLGVMYRDGLLDPQTAIKYFSKANALDPLNVEPFLYLSRTHFQIDEIGTAIQYLEQALTLEPANPDIHGRLGLLLFQRKNYEGAAPELHLSVFGGQYLDESGEPVLDEQGNPIIVTGMPINNRSLAYYYTYGNLQAYLTNCDPARPDHAPALLEQALNFSPEDQTVIGSYTESMAICEDVWSGQTAASAAQPGAPLGGTPQPGATTTP